jgi:hypothetical protein
MLIFRQCLFLTNFEIIFFFFSHILYYLTTEYCMKHRMIDWSIMPTLAVFQIYLGTIKLYDTKIFYTKVKAAPFVFVIKFFQSLRF